MSCNGCRVLRKGCGENCILRASLQWIENPQAQAYATVFVAKFFGRAGLMSFLASVPEKQRPALFQSLLFEACGRTVNPVNGALGLLWTGNWHVCQAAVQAVLGGGTLQRIPVLLTGGSLDITNAFQVETIRDTSNHQGDNSHPKQSLANEGATNCLANLGLSPTSCSTSKILPSSHSPQQCGTQSMNSEESETTTCFENFGFDDPCAQGDKKELIPLNLFT